MFTGPGAAPVTVGNALPVRKMTEFREKFTIVEGREVSSLDLSEPLWNGCIGDNKWDLGINTAKLCCNKISNTQARGLRISDPAAIDDYHVIGGTNLIEGRYSFAEI